jgi:RNA polymerase sigma-54 factor
MEMKIGLHLRQRQQLVMTPKLQQALKLLQMPAIELQQMLKQEIMENPLLDDEEELIETQEEEQERQETEAKEQQEKDSKTEEEPDEPEEKIDWDDYLQNGWELSAGLGEEIAEEFVERVPVAKRSFTEALISQLRIATDDERTIEIGDYLIGSLDESGYLTCALEEVANTFKTAQQEVERILRIIQTFDPPGVGARNLQECLLIQLGARGLEDSLATRIIREHFDDFKQKKYPELSKKLRVSILEIQAQCKVISTLDPKPGFEISAAEPQYVIPDLVVEKVDDKYVVYLNDKNIPRLRINHVYQEELLKDSKDGDRETREFIQSRLKSARWLIQTIEQRRRTMVKVMECIVDKQREFFEKGTAFLRPLTLQQVASEINMHESTVSRVTTNKYVQTPRGVFELKFFFSSSLGTQDGGEISAKSAKDTIRKIIEREEARNPLSDQKIADMLKKDGLNIARRTVAKYREQLGLLPARMRRQY